MQALSETRVEIRAERIGYRDCVELCVMTRRGGVVSIGQPLTMVSCEEGPAINQPTLTISTEEAQFLMDELWRCGLRPSEGTGSAGSLAATERHLKDMQDIAMGLLKEHGVRQ